MRKAITALVRSEYVDPAVLDACSGYVATPGSLSEADAKASIELSLKAPGCEVFGPDIERLRLTVDYETDSRLHVKIEDASKERYEVPEDVFPRPQSRGARKPQLRFNYTADPFFLFSTVDHPLIFEDQYLRIKTSLPDNPNIYGLGEHTETFRLDPVNNGRGMTRTLWSRDSYGIPNGTNLYSNHPVYFEHRSTGTHGVFLLNSNGMDVKLNETAGKPSLEYNVIGGILDFYFLAGSESNPEELSKQYAEIVGLPAEMPYWGLGFHQCRFGYKDYVDLAGVISKYKAAGIPLETMWADIDYMDRRLIFTVSDEYFPMNRMQEIVNHLHTNNQHFITMTDPAVGYLPEEEYEPLDRGSEMDVWLKNQNGSYHYGLVWPGVTVFPDWFHPRVEEYWTSEFKRFYNAEDGLDIDGSWIDMNEPASFCDYPCSDPFAEAEKQGLPPPRNRDPPAPDVPIFTAESGDVNPEDSAPPALVEAPNAQNGLDEMSGKETPIVRRQTTDGMGLLEPPYAIDNAAGALSSRTAYTNVLHANGLMEYDTHNLYGSMMSSMTRRAMIARRPGRRPLIITRSTFAGAGREVGKWLGDNVSNWEQYRGSIAGMLNFATIFNIPMVGSDVCGFAGNTTETLCARWAMLGAFNPFYRNHNGDTSISQEFYIWPLTRDAGKAAIDLRYRLLDYLYTGLHQSHVDGSALLSPLWYKYPKDAVTYPIDLQFFYGSSLLVSPVTQENSTSVRYYLPKDTWYNFATLAPVGATGWVTENDVSYTKIPLHIRGGSIIPIRSSSAMTTTELRTKPFNLVVAPDTRGSARGQLYLDDGETIDPPADKTTSADLNFRDGKLTVGGRFGYESAAGWKTVSFLGVGQEPKRVTINGRPVEKKAVLAVDVSIAKLGRFEVSLEN
ncbi:alpha-glucosidase [Coprinopsis sp. MPI-PUGE-AT-0042]|nr:alpha-glucosidase [Coprinopsis sp. MPI-PUGE-AT-0042]